MIALDTNLLVYAYRAELPMHEPARRCIESLAHGRDSWAIPWACVHEFVSVVTNRRLFRPASPIDHALDQLDAWMSSPGLILLHETSQHWSVLERTIRTGGATGPRVPDARIAAICIEHHVRELWTADRDFASFPELVSFNPLNPEEVHDHSPALAAIRRARAAGRQRSIGTSHKALA